MSLPCRKIGAGKCFEIDAIVGEQRFTLAEQSAAGETGSRLGRANAAAPSPVALLPRQHEGCHGGVSYGWAIQLILLE
jgi:hypothetical protein